MNQKGPVSTSMGPWRIFVFVVIVMVAMEIPVFLQLPLWVGLVVAPVAAGITWLLVVGRHRA